jgi:3-oxoacyl-[acyl-carrier-protein] synthase-3
MNAYIEAIAANFPFNVVTNNELQSNNPEWLMNEIETKTGVKNRHIASINETSYDLGRNAVDLLFSNQRHQLKNIDAIVFCTQTPDFIMPTNAHLIHKHLKLSDNVIVFDINLACSGFIYGLSIVNSFIKSGQAKCALLITSETYSKFTHYKNRSVRTLFGDGAAATLINSDASISGFDSFTLASNGENYDKFYIPSGGFRSPIDPLSAEEYLDTTGSLNTKSSIHMDGMSVWSFINSAVPSQIEKHLKINVINKSEIDHFIFHQGSKMTIDSLTKKLDINTSKVHINIENIGNTVSASIPLCLRDALNNPSKIKFGDRILLSGFGVGLSYGTTSFKYEKECYVY